MSSATWRTVHNTKDGSYPLGGRRFEVQWQHVSGRVVRPAVNTCSQRGAHDGRIHRPFQLMFLAEWSVSVDRPAASTRMRRTCLHFLKIPVVTGINLERCLLRYGLIFLTDKILLKLKIRTTYFGMVFRKLSIRKCLEVR